MPERAPYPTDSSGGPSNLSPTSAIMRGPSPEPDGHQCARPDPDAAMRHVVQALLASTPQQRRLRHPSDAGDTASTECHAASLYGPQNPALSSNTSLRGGAGKAKVP